MKHSTFVYGVRATDTDHDGRAEQAAGTGQP